MLGYNAFIITYAQGDSLGNSNDLTLSIRRDHSSSAGTHQSSDNETIVNPKVDLDHSS